MELDPLKCKNLWSERSVEKDREKIAHIGSYSLSTLHNFLYFRGPNPGRRSAKLYKVLLKDGKDLLFSLYFLHSSFSLLLSLS